MTTETPIATETLERIDPAKSALLVLDLQYGFIDGLPGIDALLAKTSETIELLRSRGAAIAYVHVAFAEGEVPAGRMTRLATPERLAWLQVGLPATQIHELVAPRDGDIVVRKVRIGPFSTTDLHEQLKASGIDTLLLAGVFTSGAVLFAVCDGHDRDYRLIVLSDLTADPEPDVHEFLIHRIFPAPADVISSAELPALVV